MGAENEGPGLTEGCFGPGHRMEKRQQQERGRVQGEDKQRGRKGNEGEAKEGLFWPTEG